MVAINFNAFCSFCFVCLEIFFYPKRKKIPQKGNHFFPKTLFFKTKMFFFAKKNIFVVKNRVWGKSCLLFVVFFFFVWRLKKISVCLKICRFYGRKLIDFEEFEKSSWKNNNQWVSLRMLLSLFPRKGKIFWPFFY